MARAKYIVLVGPDGSGKTTVADALAIALVAEGWSVSRKNFSFGIMPSISRVLRRSERRAPLEGLKNSGMVMPLERNRASILACWYGLDHLLGHWWLRRGPERNVVISARSYHDFLYQRSYLSLPALLPRLFLVLGPKPDIVATPLRDPREIHLQKPELTQEEIAEQYGRISRQLARYRYFCVIDASDGVAGTVTKLRERIGI